MTRTIEWMKSHWMLMGGGLLAVILLLGVIGPCQRQPPPTPDEQLVKMASQAVAMAEQAQANNDAAYLWPARTRLLVIVVGAGLPIVAVVALAWIITRRQPEELEVMAEAQRQMGLLSKALPELPAEELEAEKASPLTPASSGCERE